MEGLKKNMSCKNDIFTVFEVFYIGIPTYFSIFGDLEMFV